MTRDEWTNEAARMAPRQKEAMAYYGRSPAALLNRVYSGAIPDQWG